MFKYIEPLYIYSLSFYFVVFCSTRAYLRYVLKDVETVTGLPLLKGKEITPLAWVITLSIQLLPFGETDMRRCRRRPLEKRKYTK